MRWIVRMWVPAACLLWSIKRDIDKSMGNDD